MLYTKEDFEKFLADSCDEKYKLFHSSLTRTRYPINGVRIPILRKYGKTLAKCDNVREFLESKSECYEQVMLKGIAISYIKAADGEFFELLENFLAEIDDWAVCDVTCGGIKRNDGAYLDKCLRYANSERVWTARFGIVALMSNFSDRSDDLRRVVYNIRAKDYYIDMATAWLIQVLAVKNREVAVEFLSSERISDTVKNMAVRKIKDSFRISGEDKAYFSRLANIGGKRS